MKKELPHIETTPFQVIQCISCALILRLCGGEAVVLFGDGTSFPLFYLVARSIYSCIFLNVNRNLIVSYPLQIHTTHRLRIQSLRPASPQGAATMR